MKRRHRMPFGAELHADETRFRLWAPSAQRVQLVIDAATGPVCHDLHADANGWCELLLPTAAGTRYHYRIDDQLDVPDPASRSNPDDVHGASVVVDPTAFDWDDRGWYGRPWEEVVLYELHVGSFSPEGTFAGVESRLDYLADLGVTAIELMPLAAFPGRRSWGYDGVLPYAPHAGYGSPADLKRLIAAAHRRDLMVFIDVVYNHFGPDGNYLHTYARPFFTERHHTPWGAAINFDGPGSRTVRDFFIHNALYWLEEFHADGLRLDAAHAIIDDTQPHILQELAAMVRARLGTDRHVHLVLENDANEARHLEPGSDGATRLYDAQWNDDWHHAQHVMLTGETGGYYGDYRDDPAGRLARCLTEGFAYQGQSSAYRGHVPRGESSAHLAPTRFIHFLQNHDQVGNRALGERLPALTTPAALKAATLALLLAPPIPLLFMGEEFGAETPFLFFCDFGNELAAAVREGRRREFAAFPQYHDATARAGIPDPNAEDTFNNSRLDWASLAHAPQRDSLAYYRELLALRRDQLLPLLRGARGQHSSVLGTHALHVGWTMGDGSRLDLYLNLSAADVGLAQPAGGSLLRAEPPGAARALAAGRLPAFSAAAFLDAEGQA